MAEITSKTHREPQEGEFFKDGRRIIEIAEAHSDDPDTQLSLIMTAFGNHLTNILDISNSDEEIEKELTAVFAEVKNHLLGHILQSLNERRTTEK